MQLRGLLIAVVALALLAGGVWYSNKQEKANEGKPAPDAAPKIVAIPVDQIQQVEMARGADRTVLKRGDGGVYQITAPKPLGADQDAASGVFTLLSSLASERLVDEKAVDLAGYGLATPKVTVTVTKKDGRTVKLLIGDETPTSGGFFAKLDGDPRVFTMAGYNKTGIDKTSKDLQDKRLLTFSGDKLSRIELSAKGKTVEFGKNNNNEWQIVKPQPMRADGGQVEELVRKLRDAKMDPAVSDEDAKKAAAAFAGAGVIAVAKATDAAGTQQIEVRKATDNTYYAKSSAVEGVHKAATDLGDGLSQTLDDFRNKKLFDFGWSDPGHVEIKDGASIRAFSKSGDKWTSGGKQMDSTSVQNLIDKLRDLAAITFPEKGFSAPVVEATVVSADGKRTERVLISKSGNSYIARRDGEPALYELDTKRVEELQKAAADVKEPPPAPKKDGTKK